MNPCRGFTLIELLITIGIVAILSLIVIITLNPVELLKESRDARRVAELTSINRALNLYVGDNPDGSLGTASTTYISIPDPAATSTTAGNACTGLGLPSLPSGYSYHCAASSTYRNTDGTGWLPVNFSAISFTSPLGTTLPIDPINTTSSGNYYTYTPGGSWELTAVPESSKIRTTQANQITGGIALGSNLTLSPLFNKSGLVGYWKFDEGSGTTAADSSGNGNGGTLNNSPTWTASGCKVGSCLSFNGSNNYISVNDNNSLDLTSALTISAWVKLNSTAAEAFILSKTTGGYGQQDNYWLEFYNGAFMGGIGNSGSWTLNTISSPVAVSAGVWYHVVFTANGTTLTMTVNGQSNSQAQTITPSTNSSVLDTGSFGAGFFFFNGLIDDIRLYNRALSAAEIVALYNAAK